MELDKLFMLLILFLAFALTAPAQGTERKFARGIYLRNSFSSSANNNYNNANLVEMDIGVGLFVLFPIHALSKDSTNLLQLKYRPQPWVIRNLRIDVGFLPNRGGTFYASQTQPFHLTARGIDLGLSIPLYFKPSETVNAFFSSGINGCYYFSTRTTSSSPIPDVYFQNYSIGIMLDFGFLIGKINNPTLFISSRFLEQLTGNYRFREFSVNVGIPISKKFGRG